MLILLHKEAKEKIHENTDIIKFQYYADEKRGINWKRYHIHVLTLGKVDNEEESFGSYLPWVKKKVKNREGRNQGVGGE